VAVNTKKAIQFLKEVRAELRRVTWPARKDTIAGTAIVVLIVCITALYLGIVDLGLSKLVKMVLQG